MTRPTRPAAFLRGKARRTTAIALVAASVLGAGSAALANPVGPSVVSGSASFQQTGNLLSVTNSANAILDWQSFSIAPNETTRFIQPNSASSVLNRVLGNDPSQLLGQLQSNGQVWLINPAGILVGPNARIDVAGLVASTLGTSNADYLAGRLNFVAAPNAGSLQNQGAIAAPSGGRIYLIAPDVGNSGSLTVPGGQAILAAGQTVQLVDTGTPGIKVQFTGDGKTTNLGSILSDAGTVGMIGALVDNAGTLNASSVVEKGGRIFLEASQGIALDPGSRISADGTQGGSVLAKVANDSQIAGSLVGRGTISAEGDGSPGSGGKIETSAAKLDVNGLGIATGGGNWLLDPVDVTIESSGSTDVSAGGSFSPPSSVDIATLNTALGGGNSVTIDTNGGSGGSGNITVAALVNPAVNSSATLTLNAASDIVLNSGIQNTGSGTFYVALNAGGTISGGGTIAANALALASNGGVTLTGANVISSLSATNTGGNISLNNTATSLAITGIGNTGGGNVTVTNTGAINVSGNVSTDGSGTVSLSGLGVSNASTITGPGGVSIDAGTGLLDNSSGTISNGGGTGTIDLTADTMSPGAINGGTGLVWLQPHSSGTAIDLGGTATGLDLSTAAVDAITAGTLRIGSLSSGDLSVSAAIVPTASTLSLESGGTITQAAAGTITATNLAVRALGDVVLDTASNSVTNLAASLGDSNHLDNNLWFKNGPSLDIGSGIDGLTGIVTTLGTGATPSGYGVIALATSGVLSQTSGATLAGGSVDADGTNGVTLLEDNPTGVIAGSTSTGNFNYRSQNYISISSVGSDNGINAGTGNVLLVADGFSSGIGQNSGNPIIASSLALNSSGPVNLTDSSNAIGALAAGLSSGNLSVYTSTGLTVDSYAIDSTVAFSLPGITTNSEDISLAVGSGKGIIVNSPIDAADGGISLQADTLALNSTVSSNAGVSIRPSPNTAGLPITIGSGTCYSSPCLALTDLYKVQAGNIAIGSNSDFGNGATTASGAIYVAGITQGNTLASDIYSSTTTIGLLSGAGVTQDTSGATGTGIHVTDLGIAANDNVIMTSPNNQVGNLIGLIDHCSTGSSACAFNFSNVGSLNISTLSSYPITNVTSIVNGISTGGSVNLTTSSGGDITIPSQITASGNVTLTAAGVVTGSGTSPDIVAGGTVDVTANGTTSGNYGAIDGDAGLHIASPNISLNAPNGLINVETFQTSSSLSNALANGNITIVGTYPIVTTGSVTSATGTISIDATGGLTIDSAVSGSGDVTLAAHSPLTVTSSGSVSSTNGNVSLTAGAGGSSSSADLLTIGGPISAKGSITLAANSVTGSDVPTGSNVSTSVYVPPPPPPPPPTIDQCTANPSISGCSAVLPSLTTCTSSPTAAGCSAVLPSLTTCTSAPTTAGCSAVLPTLDQCTMTPSAAGCSAVLPSLTTCTSSPTTAGCSAVLPSLTACTSSPNTTGCSAVLPSLTACTSAPTTAGCSAVLPSLTACTSSPTTAGCSAVLPSLTACTSSPTTAGCSAVLPTLDQCTASPSAAGCSAVLPSLTACTSSPTTAGCSAVLPTLDQCTSTPTAEGCSAVLPTVTACISTPSLAGCSVVLPTASTCAASPTTPGCAGDSGTVTTIIDACSKDPNAAGCASSLPTVQQNLIGSAQDSGTPASNLQQQQNQVTSDTNTAIPPTTSKSVTNGPVSDNASGFLPPVIPPLPSLPSGNNDAPSSTLADGTIGDAPGQFGYSSSSSTSGSSNTAQEPGGGSSNASTTQGSNQQGSAKPEKKNEGKSAPARQPKQCD